MKLRYTSAATKKRIAARKAAHGQDCSRLETEVGKKRKMDAARDENERGIKRDELELDSGDAAGRERLRDKRDLQPFLARDSERQQSRIISSKDAIEGHREPLAEVLVAAVDEEKAGWHAALFEAAKPFFVTDAVCLDLVNRSDPIRFLESIRGELTAITIRPGTTQRTLVVELSRVVQLTEQILAGELVGFDETTRIPVPTPRPEPTIKHIDPAELITPLVMS